jgi:hypothetical protein
MDKIHYKYDKNKVNKHVLYLIKIFKKYSIPKHICEYTYYYIYELAEYDYQCIHNNGGTPFTIYYCINKLNKPIYIFDNYYYMNNTVLKEKDGIYDFYEKILLSNDFYKMTYNINTSNNKYLIKTIKKLVINISFLRKNVNEQEDEVFEKIVCELLDIIHNKGKFYYEYSSLCSKYENKIEYIKNIFDKLLINIFYPILIKKIDNTELFIGNDLQNIPSRIYKKKSNTDNSSTIYEIAEEYEDGNIKHSFWHGNSIIFLNKKKKNYTYTIIGGSDCIRQITIPDKIVQFVSPLGNSDVPYHYALSEKNIYFTADSFQIININNFIDFLKNNYGDKLPHLNLNKNTICKYDFSWYLYKYEESNKIEYIQYDECIN